MNANNMRTQLEVVMILNEFGLSERDYPTLESNFIACNYNFHKLVDQISMETSNIMDRLYCGKKINSVIDGVIKNAPDKLWGLLNALELKVITTFLS